MANRKRTLLTELASCVEDDFEEIFLECKNKVESMLCAVALEYLNFIGIGDPFQK